MNSTHKVEIVPVQFTKHPNADSLSVTKVWAYEYVGRSEEWAGVTRAAYIPPDNVVDTTRPEFAFLAPQAKHGKARIQARRLRGIVSYGLMIPVPDDVPIGDDWTERLGVVPYEPPLPHEPRGSSLLMGGECAQGPNVVAPKYDLEAFLRYNGELVPGERVLVTIKCDGTSARYVWSGGEMHCGSRTTWKKEFPEFNHVTVGNLVARGVAEAEAERIVEELHSRPKKRNVWWDVLRRTPELERFCRDHPDTVVYSECYGSTNAIKYGFPDVNRLAAFDLLKDGKWVNAPEARDRLDAAGVSQAPLLADLAYDFETVKAMASGDTLIPDAKPGTMREGVVIVPEREREHPKFGRVKFKLINPDFLEKYR